MSTSSLTPGVAVPIPFRRQVKFLVARFRGRRDGRTGWPSPQDRKCEAFYTYKEQGQNQVRVVAARWHDLDKEPKGKWCGFQVQRRAAEQQAQELEAPVREAKKRYDNRREALEKLVQRFESRLSSGRNRIGTWTYRIGLSVLFLGEFPLNAVAFRLFGEVEWLTWIMTTGIAFALLLSAHALGVQVRTKPKDRDRIILWASTISPVLVIAAVAIVREVYLNYNAQVEGGLTTLGPVGGTVVFLLVNAAVFLAAFFLSYLRHDPELQAVEEQQRQVDKADRDLRQRTAELNGARQRLADLDEKMKLVAAKRVGLINTALNRAKATKDLYEELMSAYGHANRRARRNREIRIPALDDPPRVMVPPELEQPLDWNCEPAGAPPPSDAGPAVA